LSASKPKDIGITSSALKSFISSFLVLSLMMLLNRVWEIMYPCIWFLCFYLSCLSRLHCWARYCISIKSST